MEKNKKRISIIIPTYNRAEVLIESLRCLEKQLDKKSDEILIVDDGSKESEKVLVEKFIKDKGFYQYVYKENEGPAKARNLAVKKSMGEILIFLNDDSLVNKDFIRTHLNFHKENEVGEALIGKFDENPSLITTPIMKWLVGESNLHFSYPKTKQKVMPWYYFWTGNLSIKKKFFNKNNLEFDTDFRVAAWEDVEFGYRAKGKGLKIYFDEKASAWHNHYFDYKDVLKRFYAHGRGLYTVSSKLPHQYLPVLAKKKYQLIARAILVLTVYPVTKFILEKFVKIENRPLNVLMQYLIVGEKIKGWDYEKRK